MARGASPVEPPGKAFTKTPAQGRRKRREVRLLGRSVTARPQTSREHWLRCQSVLHSPEKTTNLLSRAGFLVGRKRALEKRTCLGAEFEIECGLTREFPHKSPSVGSDLYVNRKEAHVIRRFPRLAENEPAREMSVFRARLDDPATVAVLRATIPPPTSPSARRWVERTPAAFSMVWRPDRSGSIPVTSRRSAGREAAGRRRRQAGRRARPCARLRLSDGLSNGCRRTRCWVPVRLDRAKGFHEKGNDKKALVELWRAEAESRYRADHMSEILRLAESLRDRSDRGTRKDAEALAQVVRDGIARLTAPPTPAPEPPRYRE